MQEKMRALLDNKIWDVVSIFEGAHLVGSKWVFTIKYRSNGLIARYKARLVTKRFNKKYVIDYLKTFVHVGKMNTVRIILSFVVLKTRGCSN